MKFYVIVLNVSHEFKFAAILFFGHLEFCVSTSVFLGVQTIYYQVDFYYRPKWNIFNMLMFNFLGQEILENDQPGLIVAHWAQKAGGNIDFGEIL